MQELPFLHFARRLMLIDICMKFREDSFRGFQVTERTQFVTDRQTDRQTDRRTDGRPGKNNMSPNPSGGDITKQGHFLTLAQGCVHTKIKTRFSQKLLCRCEPNIV